MMPFLMRRLLSAVPTLVGITLFTFLILNFLPSDPLLTWSGSTARASAAARERLQAELRTDRPPVERYLDWGLSLLRGDLGRSLRDDRPVGTIVTEALPWTLLLNGCALLVIYGLAVPFGMLCATSPGSAADRLGGAIMLVSYSLPSFAAAVLLQEIFAVRLGLLPLQGAIGQGAGGLPPYGIIDLLRHLILPTTCLALSGWAFVARYSRAAFRSAMGREFLSVVRSKGLSRRRALLHVAANTAIPLVTLLMVILPGLVGGSVIVEQAFSWPGLGRLYVASIEARDYPVVLGLTLLSALVVLAAQSLVDLLYAAVDPRIRDRFLEGTPDA
jgi:peptide/nickel transport system permease protein